jgi:hypothetical protein
VTLELSIASARLKLGIHGHHGKRMKSRTELKTTRSHAFPAAPARMSEPQASSTRPASFRLRKVSAMTGSARSDTRPQALDGKNPQAMPAFVVSWKLST